MENKQSVIPFSHEMSFHRPDRVDKPLYVVTPVFNPVRFRKRWMLYKKFEQYILSFPGVQLVTIEAAFGEREAVIQSTHERHTVITVRTNTELWLKENLINVAVTRLPADWKYMAWVDADVQFARLDWVGETIQQLQHYKVIQMWSQFQDITNDHEVIGIARSFMDNYIWGGDEIPTVRTNGGTMRKPTLGSSAPPIQPGGKRYPGAPGLAWAMRRDAWDHLGGLIDISILGACDWYMAHALVGSLETVLSTKYNSEYRRELLEWQERANKFIKGNVGVMKGLAIHYWHGEKANRKYGSREEILISNNYNPRLDLKKDWQGLWQLTDRSSRLRDQIMRYFRERNEDA